ncbi:Surfeit locus protein 6 like protein [Trachymyrmex zeteki]|uniref:Surfeit locus protein 6 like protein n=1 Tax=Mycetomoellerius zeteki TaxID=64791 RepID=A0A151WFV6_9HYME|nr:PREDICTED: surfeit locus protein 6 homolog [Trachymyrmex zeteki]KYQ46724.1 Surfeit locus protein 6 like protein [Trachymyrmex zeteki]
MQLTMSKGFNKEEVRKMLQKEEQFISHILSIMPVSTHELVEKNDPSMKEEEPTKKVKNFAIPGKKTKRAQSFKELHAKLEELKGVKKLHYKQKLLKKTLKNKLKNKTKKEDKIKTENEEIPKVPKPKPVFNSEGKMVFSKFDFSEIGVKKKLPKNQNDSKKMLQQLQQKKEKLKQLEDLGDKEKAEDIKEKDAWKSALAKASGEKVKDDPELLKRTIKRNEQKKKYSANKWNSRIENVQKSMQERQEKRRENIMKKKKEKKQNKFKKAAKKGRIIPGF